MKDISSELIATTSLDLELLNGGPRSRVDEPLNLAKSYQIEWCAPRVNLRELALLRFIQGKTERDLAKHFGRSKTTIHQMLESMVKNNLKHTELTKEEREKVRSAYKN